MRQKIGIRGMEDRQSCGTDSVIENKGHLGERKIGIESWEIWVFHFPPFYRKTKDRIIR